jgi:hypothetical protein
MFYSAMLYDHTGLFRMLYLLAPNPIEANFKAQKMLHDLYGTYSKGVIEINEEIPFNIITLGDL